MLNMPYKLTITSRNEQIEHLLLSLLIEDMNHRNVLTTS